MTNFRSRNMKIKKVAKILIKHPFIESSVNILTGLFIVLFMIVLDIGIGHLAESEFPMLFKGSLTPEARFLVFPVLCLMVFLGFLIVGLLHELGQVIRG